MINAIYLPLQYHIDSLPYKSSVLCLFIHPPPNCWQPLIILSPYFLPFPAFHIVGIM